MSKFTTFLKTKFPVCTFWCGKKRLLLSTFFYRKNPKKWTLKKYKRKFGLKLNLNQPTSFYEKINYLKHNYFDDEQTLLTDKYRVKEFLEKGGDGAIVPKVLFYSKSVNDFKKWFYANKDRYNQFVVKTNHSCGDIFIYNDGVVTRKYGIVIKNMKKVFRMLKIGLKYNHYYTCFERNYKDIDPLIFVEEFINMDEAIEYEFMANYGQIKFINVVTNRQNSTKSEILFDTKWNPIVNTVNKTGVKPNREKYMLQFIKKYTSKFPFCRVDFIETKDKLYFCEFTFVKSGGIGYFKPAELNNSLGQLIDISKLV